MQFLNPLALAGLAAALIPLAVHLLHRCKPREVPFSNLAFLRELHQSRMRSLRLRQWLVLLLRMLALACLALAFARPALQQGGGLLGGDRPTTAVLLLDHSYSTRYTPPGGRIFDRLHRRAEEVLSLLDGGRDEVYVLPVPLQAGMVNGPTSGEAARQWLGDRAPGQGATAIHPALRQARSLLLGDDARHRELYLFTDLARPGWEDVDWDQDPDLPVFVVGPPDGDRGNRYAGDVHLSDWLAAPGQRLALTAVVGRWGGPADAEETTVDLYVDGERLQQRRVSLSPGVPVDVQFAFAPRRSGRLTGFVEIEDDALGLDNRRYFSFDVPEEIAIVIAGNDERDAYYPRRALHAAAAGDPALSVTSVRLDELSAETVADADVLILTHIEAPTPQQTRVTRSFASRGGGVLIVPGAGADASRINRELLAGIVPASLASISGQPGGSAFVQLDTARVPPVFDGLLRGTHDWPTFHATFSVTTQNRLSVLARFGDGQPALVEGRSRSGHVLLWSTPFDLAWSDLPLRGLFVPMMQRLARYLAQPTVQRTAYIVGDRAWRRVHGAGIEASIGAESPSGRRLVVQAEELGDERLWRVPELDEAGIWQLRQGEDVVDAFAVNVDLAEADLTRISPTEIRQRLGDQVQILEEEESMQDAVAAVRFGRELWRELLVLAGLLLMLELWVARAPASAAEA
ncbi:MAG: hypothetical protein CME04_25410 [Gemmatimonadaceae bacterium]|nr:hypothetical protein [Gemmatimonadaceae bacterium]